MDRLIEMETYIRVVEAGSFSMAAKQLNLGQPAISKTIARLEERLGVRLLLRSTRGLTPSDVGQRFYEHAKRAVIEADEAEQAVRDASAGLSGTLRVSAAVTFARMHILPKLPGFLEQHPDLNIDLRLSDSNIDLIVEGMDVALRMGALQDSGMTARRIAQSPRRVVGTSTYFARAGVPQTPQELSQHQAIIYSQRGGGENWRFRQKDQQVEVSLSGRVRVSAAEGMRTTLLAHLGLAVTSEWMFSPELAQGEVQTVLSDWQLPPVDLWAVFPSGRLVSAKARAFVAFVESVLNPPD